MKSKESGWRGFGGVWWSLSLAVILTVLYKLGDAFVMGHLIKSRDEILPTLTYLSLGASIGLMINCVICAIPGVGKLVDPTFTGSIARMSSKAHIAAAVSGIFAAIGTGIYLWSFRTLDPSLVVPLTSLVVLYVAIAEALRGRIKFSRVLPSIGLVLIGVGVASFNGALNLQVTGCALFMVLLVYNIITAISELISKDGVDSSDAVSFGFWRFVWLTVAAVFMAITYSLLSGKFNDYLQLTIAAFSALPFISLVMTVVFFANGWANRGLALSNATTKNVAMTTQIVLSVFVTALVAVLLPNVFPAVPATNIQWTLRLVGTTILMFGIIQLNRTKRLEEDLG